MQRQLLALLVLAITPAVRAQDVALPPEKAAATITLPEGFRATLCASEPAVIKPIAMTIDARGRVWVVESHSYPKWRTDGKDGGDRILIFEDTKGAGRFDSCTVFWDKGSNLSGIALGFGGVWLCATPNLLFIPIKPGEDRPAGPPVVVLDGWSLKAQHNVFNALTWGPDGWLYGCNGITDTSWVGKPGTPDKERTPLNCGVWRYHPIKKQFEAFAWGTTNPWGLDFDDYGEMFITNCVIKHLWHVMPGAHFQRMHGQDLNPHVYSLMESCADHLHWAGGNWTSSRGGQGAHGESGGGHAHVGAMVYLGDNWPDEYRHKIFMCNLHGLRVNQDTLERKGSGYVATHGKDLFFSKDPWFRGLALHYGPDGAVYLTDWSDTGECHNYDKVQPSGRIFKITFGQPKLVKVDLAKLGDEELVRLQVHKNDWYVRQARRLLQERAGAGKLAATVRPLLEKSLADEPDVTRKLRALWALYVIGAADEKMLLGLLDRPQEALRVWAIRLLVNERQASAAATSKFAALAQRDRAASVRLALASALQRLPLADRWTIAEGLLAHAEDWNDQNLPLMIWYGVEPLVPAAPERVAGLLAKARLPLLRQYLARRSADLADKPHAGLVRLLGESESDDVRADILRGMYEALQGRRKVPMPEGWAAVQGKLAESANGEIRRNAAILSVIFGDQQTLASLRRETLDAKAAEEVRKTALKTLVDLRAPELLPLLQELVSDPLLRSQAIRGLASFNDATIPELIIRQYASFKDAEKADAINTLASRPTFALPLLEAMEKEKIPRRDLSAFTARQLVGLNDKRLTDKLTAVWGAIRPTAKDKSVLLAKYKSLVPPDALTKADRGHGRALFVKSCANCHILFGEGGKIGPDLTGSQRTNPEYLLTKILDPSAVVARDYQMTIIETTGGRVINGIVVKENQQTLTVQTQNEAITLPKGDIQERKKSELSMMPEGQLGMLSDVEIRDLIAYLAGPGQVPLPK